jgi:hypothetical protein
MSSEHPTASVSTDELEAAGSNYGDVPLEELQSKAISCQSWTDVVDLDEAAAGRSVLIRGSAQAIRKVSKKMAFVVLRQRMSTVQCMLHASDDASMQLGSLPPPSARRASLMSRALSPSPERPSRLQHSRSAMPSAPNAGFF